MAESILDRKLGGRLRVEHAVYLAVAVAAVFLFTWRLGVRPYHHDESIHAFFSWKIVQEGVASYKYDPVYHGPVLYFASAACMWLFGDSDFTGRLSAVLFGFGVLAFAWPLRRYLGRWGALCFLCLVTFSPAWVYFIRFVRHDIYLALCNLAAIYFAFRYGDTRRAPYLYAAAVSLALGFCTKEDNYLLTPVFLCAFTLMMVWEVLGAADPARARRAAWTETRDLLRRIPVPLITSGILFTIVWAVLYSSFFTNEKYTRNLIGPATDAIRYWMGQHAIKRIGGPWWYYVPQLSLYEPLIFFPAVAVLLGPVFGPPPRRKLARWFHYPALAVWVAALLYTVAVLAGWVSFPRWAPLVAVGALGTAALAMGSVWVPDRFTRFAMLWALAALTVYGWAQEKVPWLLVPQLLPLTLVAARWWGERIENGTLRRPGPLVGTLAVAALTLWSLINVNFIWDAPKPDEPGAKLSPPVRHEEMLSYVQSTYHINKLMQRIESTGHILGTGTQTRLAISGNATWPFSWYVRHYPVNWGANLRRVDYPVVIVDKEASEAFDNALLPAYEKVPFQIRAWWQWEQNRPSLVALVRWLLTRVVWSPTGSSDGVAYFLRDLRPGMTFETFEVNPPPAARGYPTAPKVLHASAVWGGPGSRPGRFNEPRDLDVDGAGNIYVVDSKNHRVQKLSPEGKVLHVWGSKGNGPGQFQDPCGIAVGPDGSVYVADTWNHRIQKFDADGQFLKQWTASDPGFWGPRGVAVSPEGQVFVTDTGNKRIVVFTADGDYVRSWGSDGSQPGQLIEPVGIAIDPQGRVVVADTGNHRLQFFEPDGTFVAEWPVFGWEEFYSEPYVDVYEDAVYVTDSPNHRFARYRNGKLDGVWGRSGAGGTDLNRPIGIAVDRYGDVYVSDTMNHRVMKFSLAGEPPKAAPLDQ